MSDPQTEDRLIRLEMAIAHLQHDLEQMHEALVGLNAELRGSREHVSRLEHKLQKLAESPEFRDPSEERPPHY